MAPPPRTWIDDDGVVIAGPNEPRRLALWAGALHYWHLDPNKWSAALAGVRALGLTCVDAPVPWGLHEPSPGTWRWSGRFDLRAFVERAAGAGLSVVLRPGPDAGGELAGHGFPDDVLRDPAMCARTAHGSPAFLPSLPRAYAVPSLGSEALHRRVARWYAALGQQLEGLRAPEGPIVALVLHAGPARFRDGAYDLDYHDEVVARWAQRHPRWPTPPRAWAEDDSERCLAWLEHKRAEVERAEALLVEALQQTSLAGLATIAHGDVAAAPRRGARTQLVSAHGPRRAARLRRAALDAFGGRGCAFGEAGVGDAPHVPPAGVDADLTRALTLLAAGARGLFFSMAVERPQWCGALLDHSGGRLPESRWAEALLGALRAVDWPALRRRPAVAVLSAESQARTNSASCLLPPGSGWVAEVLGLATGGLDDLGEEGSSLAKRWSEAIRAALERTGGEHEVLGEDATLAQLARFRAVIAPVARALAPELWHTLGELVATSPTTVITGPTPAEQDAHGRPWTPPALLRRDRPKLGRIGRLRPGSLDDPEGLAADVAALSAPAPWSCEGAGFVLALHYDEARARVAFVFNDNPVASTATLRRTDGTRAEARDALTNEALDAEHGALRVPVPAESVRMLLLDEPA